MIWSAKMNWASIRWETAQRTKRRVTGRARVRTSYRIRRKTIAFIAFHNWDRLFLEKSFVNCRKSIRNQNVFSRKKIGFLIDFFFFFDFSKKISIFSNGCDLSSSFPRTRQDRTRISRNGRRRRWVPPCNKNRAISPLTNFLHTAKNAHRAKRPDIPPSFLQSNNDKS